MACIARQATAEPENHEAICSDPAELLAYSSHDMVDSGYQAVLSESKVFPAKPGLPADGSPGGCSVRVTWDLVTENLRTTLSVVLG